MHQDQEVSGGVEKPSIFIVGASSGIGEALYKHFDGDKTRYCVIGTYLSNRKTGLTPMNATNAIDVGDVVPRGMGNKTTLLCCAGVSFDKFAHKLAPFEFEQIVRENLTGAFTVASRFLEGMRAYGWGRIIFFGSVVPSLGVMGTSAYSAAKAGLWGLTKTLAAENATKGITVNCLDLGYFDMGMGARLTDEQKQGAVAKIPMGRFGTIEPIIAAIEFLEACDYITGERIRIAGGL